MGARGRPCALTHRLLHSVWLRPSQQWSDDRPAMSPVTISPSYAEQRLVEPDTDRDSGQRAAGSEPRHDRPVVPRHEQDKKPRPADSHSALLGTTSRRPTDPVQVAFDIGQQ